jgi:hypothetical protein
MFSVVLRRRTVTRIGHRVSGSETRVYASASRRRARARRERTVDDRCPSSMATVDGES